MADKLEHVLFAVCVDVDVSAVVCSVLEDEIHQCLRSVVQNLALPVTMRGRRTKHEFSHLLGNRDRMNCLSSPPVA